MVDQPLEISCQQVKQLLDSAAELLLLDCREAEEHAFCAIAGARLLPMSELAARHEELAEQRDSHIVVYCHHGMRSAQVTHWLREQGFSHVQSMAGGIDQWAIEIDASLPRY